MRYLAIDFGLRRTGLATGDDETGLAAPVGLIELPPGEAWWKAIEKAVDEHGPQALVLGLPLNMDGTSGPAAEKMRAMASELQQRTGLAVHLMDERLSSYAADQKMARSGLTRGQKKARRDAIAAAGLLEDFLRSRPQGK